LKFVEALPTPAIVPINFTVTVLEVVMSEVSILNKREAELNVIREGKTVLSLLNAVYVIVPHTPP